MGSGASIGRRSNLKRKSDAASVDSISSQKSSSSSFSMSRNMFVVGLSQLFTGKKAIIGYLRCWPGSLLEWSDQDWSDFAGCFSVHVVGAGNEVRLAYIASFSL